MAGPRGRLRRRGGGSGSTTTTTASKAMLGALGVFSMMYLFSSHVLITRQGPGSSSVPSVDRHGSGGGRDLSSDDVSYEEDPRFAGGGGGGGVERLPQHNEPAEGPMDYIKLQCEGGVPDVDLSYWKDIPQDK